MKRLKLRAYVIPSISSIVVFITILLAVISIKSSKNFSESLKNIDYVTKTILDTEIAVISENSTKIINPFTDQNVTIGKKYYDYKASASDQEKSIIYHNDTYMQNSGIDFVSEGVFDVISVLNGTVVDTSDNEILGKTVEISHDNGLVTIYQSLSEINVKKGDVIYQGQVIGKSGTNKLDKELGNHLHFEFYTNGQIVDPNLYLNKEIAHKKNKE